MFYLTLDFKLTLHKFVYDTMHSPNEWDLMLTDLCNTLKDKCTGSPDMQGKRGD